MQACKDQARKAHPQEVGLYHHARNANQITTEVYYFIHGTGGKYGKAKATGTDYSILRVIMHHGALEYASYSQSAQQRFFQQSLFKTLIKNR